MKNLPVISNGPPFDLTALDRAALQPSTRAKYKRAVTTCLESGLTLTDRRALTAYAQGLSSSGRAFLKAAIKLLCKDLESDLKSKVNPENIQAVQAALLRLDALTDVVKAEKQQGTKAHFWLSGAQVKALLDTCGPLTLAGRRDWVILAVLVGGGLRREELAKLTFENVKVIPLKEKFRTVLEVTGKGNKTRVIPIADRLANRLNHWNREVAGGKIARSLGRAQLIGDSLSTAGIFDLVRKHGAAIGIPSLAPHDLRRTYAQLGYESGIQLTQISRLLGHASVATTQKYLNLSLDLNNTISDFIPL